MPMTLDSKTSSGKSSLWKKFKKFLKFGSTKKHKRKHTKTRPSHLFPRSHSPSLKSIICHSKTITNTQSISRKYSASHSNLASTSRSHYDPPYSQRRRQSRASHTTTSSLGSPRHDSSSSSISPPCTFTLSPLISSRRFSRLPRNITAFIKVSKVVAPACECSASVFPATLLFVDRILAKRSNLRYDQPLVLSALLIAMKYCDDASVSNSDFAMLSNMTPSELNTRELDFLFNIEFDLKITKQEYLFYHKLLFGNGPMPAWVTGGSRHIVKSHFLNEV